MREVTTFHFPIKEGDEKWINIWQDLEGVLLTVKSAKVCTPDTVNQKYQDRIKKTSEFGGINTWLEIVVSRIEPEDLDDDDDGYDEYDEYDE
jgi:hypothetical protein